MLTTSISHRWTPNHSLVSQFRKDLEDLGKSGAVIPDEITVSFRVFQALCLDVTGTTSPWRELRFPVVSSSGYQNHYERTVFGVDLRFKEVRVVVEG